MVKISDAIRKLVILKKSEGASYRTIAKDLNTINSCERKPPRTYLKVEGQAKAQFGRKSICAATQRRTPFLLLIKLQHHVICSIKFP